MEGPDAAAQRRRETVVPVAPVPGQSNRPGLPALARVPVTNAVVQVDGAAAGGREGLDYFRQAISDVFVPLTLSIDDVETFRGHVRSANLGTIQLSDIRVTNDLAVRRTPKLIRRGAPNYLKVAVPLQGNCVVIQDGREAILAPRDYAVYDTTRPYTLAFRGAYRVLVAMFPGELMRLSQRQLSGLTARRLSGRNGLGTSVSAFLVALCDQLENVSHCGTVYLADALLDMFAASFVSELFDVTAGDVGTDKSALSVRVRAFIEYRLGETDLDVSTVAAAHHVSVRYLQKLFEVQGETVTGWIRDRRVEHCRRDLGDARFAQLSVGSIAARWGLVNASHFSRVFKARTGLTPSEYRAQMRDRR